MASPSKLPTPSPSRGEVDDSGDEQTPQCRRSTKNPRIGLGFHNKSEDLVQLTDEEDTEIVGGVEKDGDAPVVTLIGVHTGSYTFFHDGRIVPDSVCTMETLARLREEYKISDDIDLSLPHRGYDAYTPPRDVLLIQKMAFECGVRLSLHPTLLRALVSLELAPLQISPGFWKHLTGFSVLWREQCARDNIDKEPGLDELRYLFQIAYLVPREQFYLRASNEMKFIVPSANVKYVPPWKEKWFVVKGEWGNTAYIGGFEYPVPTQFTTKDKWAKGLLSSESWDILGKILRRGYVNVQYPTLDQLEGGRLEKFFTIFYALPVSATQLVTGSPTSSGKWTGSMDLPPSSSLVPSLPHSPFNTVQATTTQPDAVLIPPSTLAKPLAKIPSPLSASAGSLVRTPARPSTRAPRRQSIRSMLARATKARGTSEQSPRKTRKIATHSAVGTPPNPPPAVLPSRKQPRITEKEAAPASYPAADVPLGSGSGGASHDEAVSQFVAFCPEGSLMNMAKLPIEILVTKGASVLAEAAKASKNGRQAAIVEAQHYLRCLDTETVWSLRQHEERECLKRECLKRECLKREKRLLQDENRLSRKTVQNLEAQEGSSFEYGYFTACYEIATALPPPFDLQTTLNWDREQIMAKAAHLASEDQAQEDSPHDDAHPGWRPSLPIGT
ncbi:hypothetical protein LWI28_014883 [Acer negundo]|uniref:Uncharacterized protein n=1 Tax=Acer negundo TaxID=4023 RepID=A0AAD5J639_ACENE|nr:hypothetical protein LWI28_014883 [Acer negundo]